MLMRVAAYLLDGITSLADHEAGLVRRDVHVEDLLVSTTTAASTSAATTAGSALHKLGDELCGAVDLLGRALDHSAAFRYRWVV